MATYTTRSERAALRCALGDAAALCDALAREIAAENRGRGGKSAVTKLGMQLEAVAIRCGDAIWQMRDSVTVPQPERVSPGSAPNTDAPGQIDPRDPDPTREGIFRDHNCWKCKDGALPCPKGHSLNCEFPHARND